MATKARNVFRFIRTGVAAGAFAGGITHPAPAQAVSRSPQAAPLTPAQRQAMLRAPSNTFWSTRAPDTVTADIQTSRGTITVELPRDWAPHGVDRFYNLARAGYFDDSRFYRVVYAFVAQFGIAGDPTIARLWSQQKLRPDSARTPNARGTIAYAQTKPTDRTTNLFINLADNKSLDSLGFVPIGRVVQGMEVADSLYSRYGEMTMADPPFGDGKRLYRESNKYMDAEYPKLDRILKVTIRRDR
ncbi:MAG TPA: peptidylprolyl isomerase [Gemmatimonadaceae bacterium]|jgi:cyclophilin family peptidyl-prolyl cis-trans isomerase|nr:peptidylprolyl isomerase [Gemmatimonadaceae bacterium]